MNNHNQKPILMLNKQDIIISLLNIYEHIKILKSTKFLTSNSRSHFQSIIESQNETTIENVHNLQNSYRIIYTANCLILKGLK